MSFKIFNPETREYAKTNAGYTASFKSKSEANRFIAIEKLKDVVVEEITEPDHAEAEAERSTEEAKTDIDVATRTSRYDQDLKERARVVGINPDNFAEEHILGEAVSKAEAEAEAEKENDNVGQ